MLHNMKNQKQTLPQNQKPLLLILIAKLPKNSLKC